MGDHGPSVRAKFIGEKDATGFPLAFLEGVPARDLDDHEYEALTNEQREAVRDCGLYDVKTEREVTEARRRQRERAEARATAAEEPASDTATADQKGGE